MKKITFLLFTFIAFNFGFSQNGGDTCGTAVVATAGDYTATLITQDSAGSEMGTGGDSAFFVFTAPADGTLVVSTCDGGADTFINVGTGTCGALVNEGYNDDACASGLGDEYASFLAIVVTSGAVYYIEFDDRYVSGANAFDWTLVFETCVSPTATVAIVDDCGNNQFSIDVDVTDLGNNGSLSITNSVNGDVVDIDSGVGVYTAGPFATGTAVSIQIVGDDEGCDIGSTALSDGCPPPNGECANAIAVTCDDVVTGSTVAATDSGGNPANDVWFSYTGSGSVEDVTLSLCNSAYDTAIRVFSDCPATNQVLFSDDSDTCAVGSVQSYGTFSSDGTTTYYIMIEGWNTSNGVFELEVTCSVNIPAPTNDLCSNAEALALDTPTVGSTAGATDNSTGATDDTACDGFTFKSDVWYTFVALDEDVNITTTITGSSDQANVAVYSSLDCSQLDVDSIACSSGNGGETINVTGLTPASVYFVRVWSDGVAARNSNRRIEGTFGITISDLTLTTEDFDANGDLFTYYPNPVDNTLTLKAQNNIQNVSVFNMLGQEVISSTPNAIENNIDMSTLQSGAYFVKVTIQNTIKTIRIIKN